jgi:hypothetical protein
MKQLYQFDYLSVMYIFTDIKFATEPLFKFD